MSALLLLPVIGTLFLIVLGWRGWLRFLAHQETGEALALFRICMGGVLISALMAPLLAGAVPVIWLPIEHGGYLKLERSSWMMELLGGPTPVRVYGALGLGVLAGLALVAGVWSRVAAFIGLQCFLALAWINPHAGGSYDVLITNALWLLVLARSDATWSLTARIRQGSWATETLVAAWPRYLVILQLLIMYTSSGWQKLSIYWVPGGDFSALYYIMQQPTWQRWDMTWIAPFYPLAQASTALVWFFETLGAPLLILVYLDRTLGRRAGPPLSTLQRFPLRKAFIIIGLGMHLGIYLTMEVGPFSWASLAYYAAFFHPDEIKSFLTRIHRGPPLPASVQESS